MKIRIELVPRHNNKKATLFDTVGDMILYVLPGLIVLTAGLVFTERWPPMEGLPPPVLYLTYLCVIWCSFSVVVLCMRIKRWFPTLTCIVELVIILLILLLIK